MSSFNLELARIFDTNVTERIVSEYELNCAGMKAHYTDGIVRENELICARMEARTKQELRRLSFPHNLGRPPPLSPLLVFRSVGMVRRSSTTIEHCLRS